MLTLRSLEDGNAWDAGVLYFWGWGFIFSFGDEEIRVKIYVFLTFFLREKLEKMVFIITYNDIRNICSNFIIYSFLLYHKIKFIQSQILQNLVSI